MLRRRLRVLIARPMAAWCTRRGRRALARGDLDGATRALERALAWRPDAFVALVCLARTWLERKDLYRAHRLLAQARESDARCFEREVIPWLARAGLDVGALLHDLGGSLRAGSVSPREADASAGRGGAAGADPDAEVEAGARRRAAAVRARGRHGEVPPASLPWGDCRDLDEYARFQAMPPISRAEREAIDWESVLADLLEE